MDRRIYLDTAVYINIADGKIDANTVARFLAALKAAKGILVVSIAHGWDLYQSGDPNTLNRTVEMIEGMGAWFVTVTPDDVETPRIEAVLNGTEPPPVDDVTIAPAADLRQAFAPVAAGFRFMAELSKGFAAAENMRAEARRAGSSPADRETDLRLLEELLQGATPEQILSGMGFSGQIPPEIAQNMSAGMMPMLSRAADESIASHGGKPKYLARAIHRRGGPPADMAWSSTPGGEDKWMATARTMAPGRYVAKKLAQVRAKDDQRAASKSDLPDREHSTYLPYMDFATVDRENHGLIEQAVREVTPVRRVKVFRDGDFDGLIKELEAVSQS